ncbi:MAG: RecX family transcriptional regulator [Alphaproteobacteria bacterium]|nr:RecX family transcriptional regulator [Alphaproteobacteria bacterium]
MANRRPPPVPTPERLEKAALRYLERYAASAEGVRRVLTRSVERAVRAGVAEREPALAAVDSVVARLLDRRLLDDRRFAEGRAASLARKGLPRVRIAQRLQMSGVGADDVAGALEELAESGIDDPAAAVLFARRKRLGPFADPSRRAALRERHLATMARAGFSLDLARRVVDAENPDEIET